MSDPEIESTPEIFDIPLILKGEGGSLFRADLT
jgi:hypothetical protein